MKIYVDFSNDDISNRVYLKKDHKKDSGYDTIECNVAPGEECFVLMAGNVPYGVFGTEGEANKWIDTVIEITGACRESVSVKPSVIGNVLHNE